MPAFIRLALSRAALMDAYKARPPYQQNDYIGWITRAMRDDTRAKRLDQMLRELRDGKRYMGMKYNGAKRTKP
jgi:uncharacterized protein YdeI (YjbR/CyaY-like superfamily)